MTNEQRTVLDPTSEQKPKSIPLAPRLSSLEKSTIGLLDISKPKGHVFLDRVEQELRALGATVLRFQKPTFAKPAPVDLRHEIATRCDAVVEALAD